MNKTYFHHAVVVVLLLSHVWLFVTSWTVAHQNSLSFTIFQSLFKLMSIESMMLSNRLILCHPVILLPLIFPSIRVFSNKSALCIRWPEYWSFSFSISPSNEHSGLISFRFDWFYLLAVQGTLKSLHHSSKASILRHSAFFVAKVWADYGSDHELLIEKFRLKLKKVGKTTKPFRYDLNQILYDYMLEMTSRFKRLDLASRVPKELWTEVHNLV